MRYYTTTDPYEVASLHKAEILESTGKCDYAIEAIVDKWKSVRGNTFGVAIEGIAVGFIAYQNNENCIYISDLYICPEYRRMGLARNLIMHIDNSAFKIRLKVDVKNVNAIKLYKSVGFILEKIDNNRLDMVKNRC